MKTTRTLTALAIALVLTAGIAAADWNSGVGAFKAGNFDTAAQEFQAIVDAQPEWPGGHFMLGWTKLKQKKHSEAVAHLRKAYDLNKNDVNIQLRLGEAYVAAGRYSDAVGFLGKIDPASLPSNDLKAFLAQLKAVAMTKTGNQDQALAEFARAARMSPDDASVQYQYGTAAYNAGDTDSAVSALAKAASLEPNDVEKQSAYAKALSRQGRLARGAAKQTAYDRAAAAAQKVVSANPSFENLMLLGETQLGAKRYDDAIGTFERASNKNAGDWLPLFYIGQAHTAKQQYKSAEASLKLAVDKASAPADKVQIWKQLGFIYEKQKAYQEAIAAYQRAGDSGSAQRVQENWDVLRHNKEVEAEAAEIQRMQEEQEKIRKELQELPGGPPPRR